MRRPVEARLHPAAEEELQAAALWYEEQLPGLGARFLDAVAGAVGQIEVFPAAGSPLPRRVRGHLLRRRLVAEFPFALVYLEHGGLLTVLAVAHARRRPGYWRGRASR